MLGLHQMIQKQDNEQHFLVEKALCNLFHEVPLPNRGLSVQISVAGVSFGFVFKLFLNFLVPGVIFNSNLIVSGGNFD